MTVLAKTSSSYIFFRHPYVHLKLVVRSVALIEAVIAPPEASSEEDDKNDTKYEHCNRKLHFHIVPPHATTQATPGFVEIVCLQTSNPNPIGIADTNVGISTPTENHTYIHKRDGIAFYGRSSVVN